MFVNQCFIGLSSIMQPKYIDHKTHHCWGLDSYTLFGHIVGIVGVNQCMQAHIELSGLIYEKSAVEAGCNVGAQGIIFTEYGCLTGQETIQLKLVDCQTSELYWSAQESTPQQNRHSTRCGRSWRRSDVSLLSFSDSLRIHFLYLGRAFLERIANLTVPTPAVNEPPIIIRGKISLEEFCHPSPPPTIKITPTNIELPYCPITSSTYSNRMLMSSGCSVGAACVAYFHNIDSRCSTSSFSSSNSSCVTS